MENLESIIIRHPFWSGLDSQHFPVLVKGASWVRFAPGELISREGEEADHFYLILRGEIALQTDIQGQGPVTIQTICAGDALGWSWLLPPFRWHFNARAAVESEAIAWNTQYLRAQAEENPSFGYDLASRMTKVLLARLHATHMQLVDFYGGSQD